jgi:hypothetical protein
VADDPAGPVFCFRGWLRVDLRGQISALNEISRLAAGVHTFSTFAGEGAAGQSEGVWLVTRGNSRLTFDCVAKPATSIVPLDAGGHPVILMPHGLGGPYRLLAWLAKGLAEAGEILVAVHHPHNTFGDFDIQAGLQHWTRVKGLTLALDWVVVTPDLGPLSDPERIQVAGLPDGGRTALSLLKGRGNLRTDVARCAEVGAASTHCRDIAKGGGDLSAMDAGLWGGDHADVRVNSAPEIDPGLILRLAPEDVAELHGVVVLVQLGEGEDRLLATDVRASGSGPADFWGKAPGGCACPPSLDAAGPQAGRRSDPCRGKG